MRRIALLLALCLLLPFCFGLTACGGQEMGASGLAVPDGMVDATAQGSRFAFFVPSGWTVDHTAGISQATVSAYATANIAAAAFKSDSSLAEYWAKSYAEISAKFKDFVMDEEAGAFVMDETAALRYKYRGTYYTQAAIYQNMYITQKDGYIYVLTYTATESEYENYLPQVESVVENFRFIAPSDTENKPTDSETDANAPSGMHNIAVSAYNDYRFYVPNGWVTDMQTGLTSAYVSESDRSSVSLSCYYPSNTSVTSIATYWDALQASYKRLYTDYTVIDKHEEGEEAVEIAERSGARYVFAGKNGGESYRVMQIFFIRGSYIYTFTYTATDALFDTHMSEVEAIIAAIRF